MGALLELGVSFMNRYVLMFCVIIMNIRNVMPCAV